MPRKLTSKLKIWYLAVPVEARRFMVKGIILLAGWNLVYTLLIRPYNLVDPWLTNITAESVFSIANRFMYVYHPVLSHLVSPVISLDNRPILIIADPCNGLDIYMLFIGFIFCVPMGTKKMIGYILTGVTGIFILNIARCFALLVLNFHHFSLINVAHHYIFQVLIYVTLFLIWERYFKTLKQSYATA